MFTFFMSNITSGRYDKTTYNLFIVNILVLWKKKKKTKDCTQGGSFSNKRLQRHCQYWGLSHWQVCQFLRKQRRRKQPAVTTVAPVLVPAVAPIPVILHVRALVEKDVKTHATMDATIIAKTLAKVRAKAFQNTN